MGFAGRLEGIAPSDIFQVISQSRMTGTLIARFQDGTAMVVFKNGQDVPRFVGVQPKTKIREALDLAAG